MVGYLKVHLRLNETLILILCSSHILISYMDNSLHIFVLSSSLQSSSPSSFYNSPHPFQCPLLTPPHTYQYAAQTPPSLFTTSILFWTEKRFGNPQTAATECLEEIPNDKCWEKRVYMNRSQINYQVEKK